MLRTGTVQTCGEEERSLLLVVMLTVPGLSVKPGKPVEMLTKLISS